MKKKSIDLTKCYFTGCKKQVAFEVTCKWGDKMKFCTCADHVPSMDKRPENMKHLPFAYEVKPIK